MSLRASHLKFRKSYQKALKKLPSRIQDDAEDAIQELLDGKIPRGRNLTKLQGAHSRYAMRVGLSYRLTFDLDNNKVATLRNIGPRENFYDDC